MTIIIRNNTLPGRRINNRIFFIRGRKVMIDTDLAELYGVSVKTIRQAIKRNSNHLPDDFMFEMTPVEFENWRAQFVNTFPGKIKRRHLPFCFTAKGVAMLTTILNSKTAIQFHICLIRVFVQMKKKLLLLTPENMARELQKIKTMVEYDKNIALILECLDRLIDPEFSVRSESGDTKIRKT